MPLLYIHPSFFSLRKSKKLLTSHNVITQNTPELFTHSFHTIRFPSFVHDFKKERNAFGPHWSNLSNDSFKFQQWKERRMVRHNLWNYSHETSSFEILSAIGKFMRRNLLREMGRLKKRQKLLRRSPSLEICLFHYWIFMLIFEDIVEKYQSVSMVHFIKQERHRWQLE